MRSKISTEFPRSDWSLCGGIGPPPFRDMPPLLEWAARKASLAWPGTEEDRQDGAILRLATFDKVLELNEADRYHRIQLWECERPPRLAPEWLAQTDDYIDLALGLVAKAVSSIPNAAAQMRSEEKEAIRRFARDAMNECVTATDADDAGEPDAIKFQDIDRRLLGRFTPEHIGYALISSCNVADPRRERFGRFVTRRLVVDPIPYTPTQSLCRPPPSQSELAPPSQPSTSSVSARPVSPTAESSLAASAPRSETPTSQAHAKKGTAVNHARLATPLVRRPLTQIEDNASPGASERVSSQGKALALKQLEEAAAPRRPERSALRHITSPSS